MVDKNKYGGRRHDDDEHMVFFLVKEHKEMTNLKLTISWLLEVNIGIA